MPGLIIRDDAASVGDYTANYVCKRINEFAPTPERPFVLGLPTGSSPIPTYKVSCARSPPVLRRLTRGAGTHQARPGGEALVRGVSPSCRSGKLTASRFKNVVTFNMDEYVGLPRDHSESYHT